MWQTWFNVPKTPLDPQTIGGAIDASIAVHEADPNSHMGAGEAIENHRINDVIDHPAESIPNDKMYTNARAYVAIVDPASDPDFDTISGAVAFAVASGGGTILIMPGTHYIAEALTLPDNINLQGIDRDTCIINCGSSATDTIIIPAQTILPGTTQYINNLTIESNGGYAMRMAITETYAYLQLIFSNCTFTGTGEYIRGAISDIKLNNSFVLVGANPAFKTDGLITVQSSICQTIDSATAKILLESANEGQLSYDVVIDNTRAYTLGAGLCMWIPSTTANSLSITNSSLSNQNTISIGTSNMFIVANFIFMGTSTTFTITGDNNIIEGNRFGDTASNRITLTSAAENNIIIGNHIMGVVTADGTRNVIEGNLFPQTITTTTTATALDLSNNVNVYQEPSATKTLTTTVPRAGAFRTLVLKTTNVTAKTITFGTGFKTTGTLAMGVTANRWYALSFVSDGTFLIQIGRTVAMA